jgi:uncharacterized protein (UPF0548 family)
LTYAEVGATQGAMPAGYRHDRYERTLGSGDGVWARAKVDVMAWKAHTHAGVRVVPDDPPAEGADVVLAFRIGPAHALAPCRIVLVVDEEDRAGFAYGTLPGHPERGEESFMVERLANGTVRFVITVFSRPDELLVRLGGPMTRQIQARVTHRYLDGLASVRPS